MGVFVLAELLFLLADHSLVLFLGGRFPEKSVLFVSIVNIVLEV